MMQHKYFPPEWDAGIFKNSVESERLIDIWIFISFSSFWVGKHCQTGLNSFTKTNGPEFREGKWNLSYCSVGLSKYYSFVLPHKSDYKQLASQAWMKQLHLAI